MNNSNELEFLFVYGTLKDPLVQQQVLGRKPDSEKDVITGMGLRLVSLGENTYFTIVEEPGAQVAGLALQVTSGEITRADQYEGDDYLRVLSQLKSGIEAWVYIDRTGKAKPVI